MADFNIQDHLSRIGFGSNSSSGGGGGSSAAPIQTPDELIKKSLDKAVETLSKGVLGVVPNIEGNAATVDIQPGGIKVDNPILQGGFLGIFKDTEGHGLGAPLAALLKRIGKDITPMTNTGMHEAQAASGGESASNNASWSDLGGLAPTPIASSGGSRGDIELG